jgi:hypothetical protein
MAYQFIAKTNGRVGRLLISMMTVLSLSVFMNQAAAEGAAKPIASFELLPVINVQGELQVEDPAYVAQYNDNANKTPLYHSTPSYVHGGGGVSLGAGIVAAGVATLVANEMQKRQNDLEYAVSAAGFRPAHLLNKVLKTLLEEKGLKLENSISPAMAKQAREDEDFSRVDSKAEAILDIRVTDHGYFRSIRAGGLSPMLGITATLIEPVTGETIDSFTYWSDWRNGGDDPRWFTTPPSITYDSTDSLRADAAAARAGLEGILVKMTVRLVEDIKRRSQGIVEE